MMNVDRIDQDDDATVYRKLLTRRRVVTASLVMGIALSFVSWWLRNLDPWWSTAFGNAGFAAFLLLPGELAVTWLTSRFQRVEHAADTVRETAEVAKGTAREAKEVADRVERLLEGWR